MNRKSFLKLCIVFQFFLVFNISAQSDPKLKIASLTGDHYVFTTYRVYKGNHVSANGLYVLTKKGAVLIDTPWDTTQFQPLLDSIKKRHGANVVICIATHSHEDRTGGLEYFNKKGIKTYTSVLTDSICRATGEKRAKFHFKNDTTFKVGQYSFQTLYFRSRPYAG